MSEEPNLEPFRWLVCRCPPSRVLGVVEALEERGEVASCPTFIQTRRVPRSRRKVQSARPALGGIFFLREDCWPLGRGMIAGLSPEAIRRLIVGGRPARVSDAQLEELREAIALQSAPKPAFRAGDKVVARVGFLHGQVGSIVGKKGSFFLVQFGETSVPLLIRPFLLERSEA